MISILMFKKPKMLHCITVNEGDWKNLNMRRRRGNLGEKALDLPLPCPSHSHSIIWDVEKSISYNHNERINSYMNVRGNLGHQ